MEFKICDNIPQHMEELKAWLDSVKEVSLENMESFFTTRINGYEDHMLSHWDNAYSRMAELIPDNAKTLLDLGCGTGLELDKIFEHYPNIEVTGIDLCETMLSKLKNKHPNKKITLYCADYFEADFGIAKYDTVITFETLHHFKPYKKEELFKKIYLALNTGGVYIEADYIACCEEEEKILMNECERKRGIAKIPENEYIHFDTPLTLEHEIALIKNAGFSVVKVVDCIEGTPIIVAEK